MKRARYWSKKTRTFADSSIALSAPSAPGYAGLPIEPMKAGSVSDPDKTLRRLTPHSRRAYLNMMGTRGNHLKAGVKRTGLTAEPTPKPLKRSKAEIRFAELLREAGAADWVEEYGFHPWRKWRFDFAWPGVKLAAEIEGGVFTGGRHTRGAGFVADTHKYNSATRMGWRVMRYPSQGQDIMRAYAEEIAEMSKETDSHAHQH